MKRICFLWMAVIGCLLLSVARGDVLINEVMASSATYENGHAYDWIEIVNTGKKTEDLSGWHISDKANQPELFTFPKGTKLKSGAYLTVFCTDDADHGKETKDTFYAPFKISSSGETLFLTDSEGNQVQVLPIPKQYGNVSWGKAYQGEEYGYLETISRGKKNDKTVGYERTETPKLETAGGFYHDSVTVTVTDLSGTVIRYTTDGSTPTKKSKIFPEKGLTVSKTTVIRIKAFQDEKISSECVSATYFINDDPMTPIVSLVTDRDYFFNKKTGALVKGTGSIPNYDKELEYPVNIEYFDESGQCEINQMGTFTCSGHSARVNAQKSIALYARKALGQDRFQFNPFPNRQYDSYKSLLLRAANSDTYATRLRDIVASSLAEGQDILYQDYVVIQVYLNGEYWGHYNLREKINKYFIAQYEGVTDPDDIDTIDILARTGTDRFTQNGDNADWLELCDFCKTRDLNDPQNLAWVEERLDIDSMFTHAAFEILLGNVDFTNVRVYRVPGGKWRFLLFDVEACWRNLDKTPIEYYIKPLNGKIQGFRHEPLNAMFLVPEMKAKFLQRVADLMEQCFQWPYVEEHFERAIDKLDPILDRHIGRWKNMKRSNWDKNISAIKYYARVRPKKIPEMLQKAMKLSSDEVEEYFGDVLQLLETTNAKPDSSK